jgi:hypothetical protein
MLLEFHTHEGRQKQVHAGEDSELSGQNSVQ